MHHGLIQRIGNGAEIAKTNKTSQRHAVFRVCTAVAAKFLTKFKQLRLLLVPICVIIIICENMLAS